MLSLLAEIGDKLPEQNGVKTIFHVEELPRVSILLYYLQLSSNAGLQDEQAIVVLVLIERLCSMMSKNDCPVIINSKSMHR